MAKKKGGTSKKESIPAKKGRHGIAPAFDLAALIAGITNENRHAEIGLGGPVGSERF